MKPIECALEVVRIGPAGHKDAAGVYGVALKKVKEFMDPPDETDKDRMEKIRDIIVGVENRCKATNIPMTPALEEDEMREIYVLAGGVAEDDDEEDDDV